MFKDFARDTFIGDAQVHRDLRLITESLDNLYAALYDSAMFLSEDTERRVQDACTSLGLCFMRLRESMRRLGKLYFRITPKVHRWMHIPMYCSVLNPRWVQNYAEESLMGSVSLVYQRAMRGKYMDLVQRDVLVRRNLALLLRLELGLF